MKWPFTRTTNTPREAKEHPIFVRHPAQDDLHLFLSVLPEDRSFTIILENATDAFIHQAAVDAGYVTSVPVSRVPFCYAVRVTPLGLEYLSLDTAPDMP
jgi:hypothetical protein